MNIDFSNLEANYSALIQGTWKLINTPSNLGKLRLLDGWWSSEPYVRTPPNSSQTPVIVDGASVMLFDLSADPEERQNVAAAHLEVVRKMMQRIEELADPSTGYRDPQPQSPDPKALPSHHDGCLAPWLDSDVTITV